MNCMMQLISPSKSLRSVLRMSGFFLRIDISEMIERAVVQFSFISIQLEKCGPNEPMVEALQTVRERGIVDEFVERIPE